MRRYIAIIAAVLVADIFLYEYINLRISIAFASVVSLVLCVSMRVQRSDAKVLSIPLLVSMMACLLACNLQIYHIDLSEKILPELSEKYISLEGKVVDIDEKRKTDSPGPGRLDIVIDVTSASGMTIAGEKILVTATEYDFQQGHSELAVCDRISVKGRLRIPDSARNPNTFDYRRYLRTRGIHTTIKADEIMIMGRSGSLSARLYILKRGFLRKAADRLGQDRADLIGAIMFGDKGKLDEDTVETFQKNGTAHILAVSGLHIGMIYAFLTMLWNRLSLLLPGGAAGRRGWAYFVFIMILLGAYSFMAGFSPSVVRALLMIALHIFAKMTGRYYDLKCAAMAVGIAALLKNPLILFQSGFQMSFLAVLSLALVIPYMRRFFSRSLLAGACIQAGLLPYIIYQFNWLSLLAVFINLPVVFIAGIMVPLGVVSLAAYGIWFLLPAVDLMNAINGVLCDLLVRLNEISSIDGVTVFRIASPHVGFVIVFYLGLVAFASEEGRRWILRKGKRYLVPAVIAILVLGFAAGNLIDDGFRNMDIVFVDVGQGDCMHLWASRGPDLPGLPSFGEKNYLIDGGGSDDYNVGKKTLMPYLLKNGVGAIDGAFVTHLHTDHYKGICDLAREGMVRRLFVYEANRLRLDDICRETGLPPERIHFLAKGDRGFLSGGKASGKGSAPADRIEVIWPERKADHEYSRMIADEKDENASSLILKATINGVSLLATGDMGEEGEKELLRTYSRTGGVSESYNPHMASTMPGPPCTYDPGGSSGVLEADILKVGHHGSKYSTCDLFIDAVSPGIAVVQVGKGNTYGHPTPEVLSRLARRDIPVCRNDIQGAIGFRIRDGDVIAIDAMR